MKIEKINYGGRIIECEVRWDFKLITLLSLIIFIAPIFFIIFESYNLAILIHFLALFPIIVVGSSVLKDYTPIHKKTQDHKK